MLQEYRPLDPVNRRGMLLGLGGWEKESQALEMLQPIQEAILDR